jgi:hypothetical protein
LGKLLWAILPAFIFKTMVQSPGQKPIWRSVSD